MAITRHEIKQAFSELQAAGHEMALVDYPSSDDEESSIHARIIHLNSMNLNFMLNDPRITMNVLMIEQEKTRDITELLAEDDPSAMFMDISEGVSYDNTVDNPILFVAEKSDNHTAMNIEAELKKRENLLKRFTSVSKSIKGNDSSAVFDIMNN
jgi:hypothetical protein